MPNKKAAIKHLRQTVKRTRSNSLVNRNIKEILKSGQKSAVKGDIKDKSAELTYSLQKAVDKAVKSGIIKPNTANRKKSRFAKMLKKAGASSQPKPVKKAESKEEKK
ncbi:30S ribosomal protein S20 [Candidatus Parcubacteria bacterium]|nr:MAG: 30S ribosomal protein S20 [Candidatus Parcubacteria bacterium]